MLGHTVARQPAPMLALRGIGLRLRHGPTAFGNALGSSVAAASESSLPLRPNPATDPAEFAAMDSMSPFAIDTMSRTAANVVDADSVARMAAMMPPSSITVGAEGAQGFLGVSKSLQPGASNAAIEAGALQLMTANQGVTTLHQGDTLALGDGSISGAAVQAYGGMNAVYQARLAATASQLTGPSMSLSDLMSFSPDGHAQAGSFMAGTGFDSFTQVNDALKAQSDAEYSHFVPMTNAMAQDAPDYTMRFINNVLGAPVKGAFEGAAIAWDSINGLATVAQNELGLGYYEAPQLSGVMRSLNAGMDVEELRGRVNPVGAVLFGMQDMQTAWNTGNSAAFSDAAAGVTTDFLGLAGGVNELASLGAGKIRSFGVPDFNIKPLAFQPGVFYSNPIPFTLEPFGEAPQVFSNRFPEDAADVRDVPSLTQQQALSMPKNILYVVKTDGSLVIAPKSYDYGHVDLARGADVLAAGEGKVLWGTVKSLDNASGHYLPIGSSAESAAMQAFSDYGFKVPDGVYQEKVYDFNLKRWVPNQ